MEASPSARCILRHESALDGRTRIRGRARALREMVPRGRRDRPVLRNVHPVGEPERRGGECAGALSAGRAARPSSRQVEVPGNGRVTINIETQDESLANVPVATEVSSPHPDRGGARAVLARSRRRNGDEAHNSFGVTETWPKWGLAEGRVGGAAGYQTYVLLANPTANTATVTITFLARIRRAHRQAVHGEPREPPQRVDRLRPRRTPS